MVTSVRGAVLVDHRGALPKSHITGNGITLIAGNANGHPPVDYEHAQPMPLPSPSGPPASRPWPDSESVRGQPGPAGSTGGDAGSGEQAPVTVNPPRPMPEAAKPADESGRERKERR